MELKDFELEAILKEALADDSVPPPELNAKLVKRIKQKKKRPSYVFNMRYAAAAAVIIVVGGAAVFSNGGFTKTHTVGEVARTTTYNSDNNSENANKQAVNPAYADDNVKTEAVTDILAESQVTDKSEEKIQKSSTEVMSDRDNIVTGNEKNRADDIINSNFNLNININNVYINIKNIHFFHCLINDTIFFETELTYEKLIPEIYINTGTSTNKVKFLNQAGKYISPVQKAVCINIMHNVAIPLKKSILLFLFFIIFNIYPCYIIAFN